VTAELTEPGRAPHNRSMKPTPRTYRVNVGRLAWATRLEVCGLERAAYLASVGWRGVSSNAFGDDWLDKMLHVCVPERRPLFSECRSDSGE